MSLSAGSVSLPVRPDTAEFGAILGSSIIGSVRGVSKMASEAFVKGFGPGLKATMVAQQRDVLASAAGVERASRQVRVAEDAQISSAAKLRVAEAQLSEAQLKHAEGSAAVVKAEERAAAAQRIHAKNTEELALAQGRLGPATDLVAVKQAKLAETAAKSETGLGRLSMAGRTAGGAIAKLGLPIAAVAAGFVVLGAESVKAYGHFEAATTRLVTDAGESMKNLGMVQQGLLKISTATGTGATEMAKGMYLVESAGYHGAAGLKVMQAAAEGAKIGGADLTTVSDALTTAMTDYAIPASRAADTTSKLIATVSVGKTTMEQLAGSLHSVMPAAEAAHISLAQVLGAVGTMTAEGISADQATQNLNHTILSLQNPTAVQTKAMAAMGLSSLNVAQNLGKRGLTGTLDLLQESIMHHMGPAGLVLQNSFNQSKLAAQSATAMLAHMPPSLQGLGKEFLNNTITQKQWTAALKDQPVLTATLGRQFAVVAKNAHGFSDSLKSGSGPAKTYAAELAQMTGGSTGLQVALHLSGIHADTFAKNVNSISKATTGAHGHVRDWAITQKTFNQLMSQAGVSLENAGIKIGKALMPAIKALLPFIPQIAKDISDLAPSIGWAAKAFVGFIEKLLYGAKQWQGFFAKLGVGWGQITGAIGNVVKFVHGAFEALGYAIGTVINKFRDGWNQIAKFVGSIAKSFGHGADQLRSFFKGVTGFVKDAVTNIGKVFNGLVHIVETVWKNVTRGISVGIDAVKNVVKTGFLIVVGLFILAWQKIVQIFGPAFRKIQKAVQSGVDAVANIVGPSLRAIAAVFTSVWNGITSFIGGIWKQITSHVSSGTKSTSSVIGDALKWISNTWNSVWGAITSFVSGVWKRIESLVSGAISAVSGFVSRGVAALQSAWSSAWNTVVGVLGPIWGRIVTAVSGGVAKVISFFTGIGGKIIGAIGNAGQMLYSVGTQIVGGLINGITSAVGGVVKAASNLAGSAIQAAKNALGVKSPSKVFHDIGQNIALGLQNGILGSAAQVASASDKLAGVVVSMFQQKKGGISRATESSALHLLGVDTKKLVGLSNQRAVLLKKISAEQSIVKAAQQQYTSDYTSVRDNTTSAFSVTNYTTAGEMVAGLKKLVADTRTFRAALAKLVQMGLDPSTYRQIVDAGVAGGGLTAAQELLAQPDTVKQIAGLQHDLSNQAKALAHSSAQHLYDAGVDAATGLLKGLQKKDKAITHHMERLAESMVHTLKKKLGIKSPSTVFYGHGQNIALGLAAGIKASTKDVHAAVAAMTGDPVQLGSRVHTATAPRSGANQGPVVYMPDTITVRDVHGFEAQMQVISDKTYRAREHQARVAAMGRAR